jgi:hypothetical protein
VVVVLLTVVVVDVLTVVVVEVTLVVVLVMLVVVLDTLVVLDETLVVVLVADVVVEDTVLVVVDVTVVVVEVVTVVVATQSVKVRWFRMLVLKLSSSANEKASNSSLIAAAPVAHSPELALTSSIVSVLSWHTTVMVAGTASSEVHSVAAVLIAAATASQYATSTTNTFSTSRNGMSSQPTGESGTEDNKTEKQDCSNLLSVLAL